MYCLAYSRLDSERDLYTIYPLYTPLMTTTWDLHEREKTLLSWSTGCLSYLSRRMWKCDDLACSWYIRTCVYIYIYLGVCGHHKRPFTSNTHTHDKYIHCAFITFELTPSRKTLFFEIDTKKKSIDFKISSSDFDVHAYYIYIYVRVYNFNIISLVRVFLEAIDVRRCWKQTSLRIFTVLCTPPNVPIFFSLRLYTRPRFGGRPRSRHFPCGWIKNVLYRYR